MQLSLYLNIDAIKEKSNYLLLLHFVRKCKMEWLFFCPHAGISVDIQRDTPVNRVHFIEEFYLWGKVCLQRTIFIDVLWTLFPSVLSFYVYICICLDPPWLLVLILFLLSNGIAPIYSFHLYVKYNKRYFLFLFHPLRIYVAWNVISWKNIIPTKLNT